MKYHISDMCKVVAGCAVTALLAAVTAGCADNVQPDLSAESASNIIFSVSTYGLDNDELTIGSAQSVTVFEVSGNTCWIAEVTECDGGWCRIVYDRNADDVIPVDGEIYTGPGTFIARTAPNRNPEIDRYCLITVYPVEKDGTPIPDHSVEIHLIQERRSLDVDYEDDEIISAWGTITASEPIVTVTADQAWTVTSSEPWVTVVPGNGMNGDTFTPSPGDKDETTVSFRLRVDENPNISIRTCEVILSSPVKAFTPTRLRVVQYGSPEASFSVTPGSVPEFSPTGGEFTFMVCSSRKDWTATAITSGDWIHISPSSGQASIEPVPVTVKIDPNSESQWREAGVVFALVGDTEKILVQMTQAFLPVISEVWIAGGWTSTQVQLCSYYQCPNSFFTPIACGAICQPVTDGSKEKIYSGTFGNNTFTVDVNDLEPNTDYVVRAYMEYKYTNDGVDSTSERIYSTEIRFRTPDLNGEGGIIPENGNNNPPAIN
ncbi:MAG: hypothetical protein K2H47_12005 [Muribaculaceae bacterium]|nr:hypothetical protein [Muribaculaceae bacterium]